MVAYREQGNFKITWEKDAEKSFTVDFKEKNLIGISGKPIKSFNKQYSTSILNLIKELEKNIDDPLEDYSNWENDENLINFLTIQAFIAAKNNNLDNQKAIIFAENQEKLARLGLFVFNQDNIENIKLNKKIVEKLKERQKEIGSLSIWHITSRYALKNLGNYVAMIELEEEFGRFENYDEEIRLFYPLPDWNVHLEEIFIGKPKIEVEILMKLAIWIKHFNINHEIDNHYLYRNIFQRYYNLTIDLLQHGFEPNLKPKNVLMETLKMENIYAVIKNKEIDKKILEQQKDFLEYEGDEFFTFQPSSKMEIIREGKNLRNCLGGYVNSAANGSATLVFIREKKDPKHSFCALELSQTGHLIQAKGFGNEEMRRFPFVREYMEYISDCKKIGLFG